jgi:hypothetical protein
MGVQPFVTVSDGVYRVEEAAVAFLATLTRPFVVLACAGKFRTGKSFLLNQLLALPSERGFGVGGTVQACTRGIWMSTELLTHPSGEGPDVLVLDTEGIDALDAENEHDVRVFAIAVLICSTFAYNSMSHLDEAAVQTLSLMTRLTASLEGAAHAPRLYWILRDFALQLVDAEGRPMTHAEYLAQALEVPPSSAKCATREAICSVFRERHLVTLPRPHSDGGARRRPDAPPLAPKFERYLRIFRDHLLEHGAPFTVDGVPVAGGTYAAHVQNVVRAVNASGALPRVKDTWTLLTQSQHAEVEGAVVAAVRARMADGRESGARGASGVVRQWLTEAVRAEAATRSFLAPHPDLDGHVVPRAVAQLLSEAEACGYVRNAQDAAREWMQWVHGAFDPQQPSLVLAARPDDAEVRALVAERLLTALCEGGELHARVAQEACDQARTRVALEVERYAVRVQELEAQLRARTAAPATADAAVSTEAVGVSADDVPSDAASDEIRRTVELEGALAAAAERARVAERRVSELEERLRAAADHFASAMDAMRDECEQMERERQAAVEEQRRVTQELSCVRQFTKQIQEEGREMHRGVLDEFRRRELETRTWQDTHHATVSSVRADGIMATNENATLKRRVDELLHVEEDSKRMRHNMHQVTLQHVREEAQCASLATQLTTVRSELEEGRTVISDLEGRVAVLNATATLERCRMRSGGTKP